MHTHTRMYVKFMTFNGPVLSVRRGYEPKDTECWLSDRMESSGLAFYSLLLDRIFYFLAVAGVHLEVV